VVAYGFWKMIASDSKQLSYAPSAGSSSTTRQQHEFIDAAKASNFRKVRHLVQACPDLVNCQPAHRWSALHHAAHQGDAGAVQFLLDHDASTALRTRDGLTPIEVAKPCVFDILLPATLAESAQEASKADAKNATASEEAIQQHPVWSFGISATPAAAVDLKDSLQCHICLEDFETGDELRTLSCSHSFHSCCVDVWLREKSGNCPVCRADCIV